MKVKISPFIVEAAQKALSLGEIPKDLQHALEPVIRLSAGVYSSGSTVIGKEEGKEDAKDDAKEDAKEDGEEDGAKTETGDAIQDLEPTIDHKVLRRLSRFLVDSYADNDIRKAQKYSLSSLIRSTKLVFLESNTLSTSTPTATSKTSSYSSTSNQKNTYPTANTQEDTSFRNLPRSITSIINALFSVFGCAFAAWFASAYASDNINTRTIIAFVTGIVVAIAEGWILTRYLLLPEDKGWSRYGNYVDELNGGKIGEELQDEGRVKLDVESWEEIKRQMNLGRSDSKLL